MEFNEGSLSGDVIHFRFISVFRSLIFISLLNRDLTCHSYPSHGSCCETI